jgi:hypothetical protein
MRGNNIRFMWKNRWDDATLSASSEESGFPVTNTQHRWHTRTWQSEHGLSGGLTDAYIVADLGDAYDIEAFIIKNHNFSMLESGDGLRIQANNADAWGAPALDEAVTMTSGLIIHFFSSAQTYRYWRIVMTDVMNSDNYLEIGRVFLGGYFEPYYDYRSRRPVFSDLSTVKRSTGGQISSDQKPRYRQWSYDFDAVLSDDFDTFWDIWQEVGLSKEYFICQDPTNDDPYLFTYYVQNLNEWGFDPIIKNADKLTISVEELL